MANATGVNFNSNDFLDEEPNELELEMFDNGFGETVLSKFNYIFY